MNLPEGSLLSFACGPADKAPAPRRRRTKFTEHQLSELRKLFSITQHPRWENIQALALQLQLDQSVVKAWFKNQVSKLKKQQQQQEEGRPVNPEAPQDQANNEMQVPWACALSSQQPSRIWVPQGPEQAQQAAASATPELSFPPASQSVDDLEVSWTDPLPYSTEELADIYDVSGDEDPSSLDEYLPGEPALLGTNSPKVTA
ncbi:paired-like homeodomain transcription factor LEUTX [Dipodomys merriami]|uniref:paired-like homeodomain transcription factor LEUTX n=1 Tax=Dipodomys merriami TaxID=94247 RepID=UPI00384C0D23